MNQLAKILLSARAKKFVAIFVLAGFLLIAPQPSNAMVSVALTAVGGTVLFDMGWFGIPLMFISPLGKVTLRSPAIIGICYPGAAVLGLGIRAGIRIKLGFIKIRISFTLPILGFCVPASSPPDMSGFPPPPTQQEMEEMVNEFDDTLGVCIPPDNRVPVSQLPVPSGISSGDRVKITATDIPVRDQTLVQGTTVTGFQFAGSYGTVISPEVVVTTELINPQTGLPIDTIPPSAPDQFTGTADINAINLSWAQPTDNVAAVGYKIFRNGVFVATIYQTFYEDTTVAPNTLYSYTVSAFDAAGNNSQQSAPVTITSAAMPQSATLTGIARGTGAGSIQIAWNNTNNPRISGYRVYRNGYLIAIMGSPDVFSYEDTGLLRSTVYYYFITAHDASGNEFSISNSFNAATLAFSTKFKVNDVVETTLDLSVRTSPSIMGAFKAIQYTGSRGTVVAGPKYADGYWWWGINYDSGESGWSVENYLKYVSSLSPASPIAPLFPIDPGLSLQLGQPAAGQAPPASPPAQAPLPGQPVSNNNNNVRTYRWWKVDFEFGSDGWVLEEDIASVTVPYITIHCPDDFTILIDNSKTTLDVAYQVDGELQAYNLTNAVFQIDDRAPERDLSIDDGFFQLADVLNNKSHTLRAWLEGAGFPKIPYSEVAVNIKGMDYLDSIDLSPPQISIVSPADGSTIQGVVTITANASDNDGVAGVRFQIGDKELGTEIATAPYAVSWDTRNYPNGQQAITAIARDNNNNEGRGFSSINIKNPKFLIGNRVIVVTTASVFGTPDSAEVPIGTQSANAIGGVLEGPIEIANVIWWKINFDTGIDGWVNEMFLDFPPLAEVSPSQNQSPNSFAQFIAASKNPKFFAQQSVYAITSATVRTVGNTFSPKIGTQPADSIGTVIASKADVDGTMWVNVDFASGTDGWVEEVILKSNFSITVPASGAKVEGMADITAEASMVSGVKSVRFRIGNNYIGTEPVPYPYTIAWDTTKYNNGTYTIIAEGQDSNGLNIISTSQNVEIYNPKFVAGQSVYTSVSATVRGTPSLAGADMGAQPANTVGTVLGGPVTADGIIWWKINFRGDNSNVDGWVNGNSLLSNFSITVPISGAKIGGATDIVAETSSVSGIIGVRFKIGSEYLGPEDTIAPYIISWDTTQYSNGPYIITAEGNRGSSFALLKVTATKSVTVKNPKFRISQPVYTSSFVSVKETSGSAGAQIGTQTVNAIGVVVEGPVTADNFIWWNVDFASGADGWVNEMSLNANVSVRNPKFSAQQSVYAITSATVRTVGNTFSPKIGTQPADSIGTVIASKADVDGTMWVNVDFASGTDGWVEEVILKSNFSITVPASGAKVEGMADITAEASMVSGVKSVRFRIGNNYIGTEPVPYPYTIAWDTTKYNNGTYTIIAEGQDSNGLNIISTSQNVEIYNPKFVAGQSVYTSVSATVRSSASSNSLQKGIQPANAMGTVLGGPVEADGIIWWNVNFASGVSGFVDGNLLSPNFAITAPVSGAKVKGVINIAAEVSTVSGIKAVRFKIGNTYLGPEDTVAPYEILWDTTQRSNGPYSITAEGTYTISAGSRQLTQSFIDMKPITIKNPKFSVGARITVVAKAFVYDRPDNVAAPMGSQLANATGAVLEGPVEISGITWWKINFDTGVDGWVNESLLR